LDLSHDFHIGHYKILQLETHQVSHYSFVPLAQTTKFATPTTQATTVFSLCAVKLFRRLKNSGRIWFTVFVSLPVVAMVEFFSDWAHICDLFADVGICIEL
jgi:hypothetical protein